jgi:hypothetical protein
VSPYRQDELNRGADHRRLEAKALGIISEIVPRDGGTDIALAK